MYDITIVGSGVSGIFLADTLLQIETKLKILMIEKGKKFKGRICPIESGLNEKCIKCSICNKIQGFGGWVDLKGNIIILMILGAI